MYTTESRAKKWGGRNETRGGERREAKQCGWVCVRCVLQNRVQVHSYTHTATRGTTFSVEEQYAQTTAKLTQESSCFSTPHIYGSNLFVVPI